MIYFISDTHFSHSNIIKYCNRPFSNVEEMNKKIIANWNSKVKSEDTVFFLGDWGFTKSTEAPEGKKFDLIRPLLNGNIIFVDGSHDKNNGCKTPILSLIIKHGGKIIELCHDPIHIRKDITWHFCGHWHGKFGKFIKKNKNIITDLSVENWDYFPVDINEINQAYSEWLKSGAKNEKKD
jgi:calcineurin-like phosphoesterase family protein